MIQRIVESYGQLTPVAADATGLDLVTLADPVEGFAAGTYRAGKIGTFATGPLDIYGQWLERLDTYSRGFRVLTTHGVQPCVLGAESCRMLHALLSAAWPSEAASGDGWAMLTDLWIGAVELGMRDGIVRVR